MKLAETLTLKTGNLLLGILGTLGGPIILLLTRLQNLAMFNKGLPGAGFFPCLCGVIITVCGIGVLFSTYRRIKRRDPGLDKSLVDKAELINFLFVIGLSLFTLVAYRWIGLMVCMFIVVFVMCRFLSGESWLKSVLIAAGTFVCFYLCFVLLLGVPMPDSLIGM